MKVRAILNPNAGVGARRALEDVQRGRPSWKDLEVRLTTGPGEAVELARAAAAAGTELVLAVGGDGTVNEAARGLLGSGVPLGIVPIGSGNGLARALRIPRSPALALAALENAVVRPIDVGTVNGLPFLNVAGVGFDALVGWAFHRAGREGGRRGFLTYVRISLALLRSYEPAALRIEAAGQVVEGRPFIVAFANGVQYGGGAVVNPGARLDDGRFEVLVFEKGSALGILATASRMFAGGIERSQRYRRIQTDGAVLTSEAPIEHHRDGEPEPGARRLEIGLLPRALPLLVPRATAEDPTGPFVG
ncbi:MAG: diacylglycerol/lipid kinase family protein [Solirubrobacterales bacterium]